MDVTKLQCFGVKKSRAGSLPKCGSLALIPGKVGVYIYIYISISLSCLSYNMNICTIQIYIYNIYIYIYCLDFIKC